MTQHPDLDPIRARHQAATSGTWYPKPSLGPHFVVSESAGYEHGIGDLNFGEGDQADADREFVLNAHPDMGLLLAEVHRLREHLRDAVVSLENIHDRLAFEEPDAADALQAVIDRLNHRAAEGV